MELKVNGKIKVLMETQTFPSGFSKREFVITTQEQYPQDVKFESVKDKITMLDGLKEGDDVDVAFNLRGNEYQGKYYVNLQAWKVSKGSGESPSDGAPDPSESAAMPTSSLDDTEPPF